MGFVIRLLGFVQWLAALVVAAVCVSVQVATLEEVESGAAAEGITEAIVEMGGGIDAIGGPGVAELIGSVAGAVVGTVSLLVGSASVTTPGLLLSILLLLSALYCQRAADARGRSKPASAANQPPGTRPAKPRDGGKEEAGDVPA